MITNVRARRQTKLSANLGRSISVSEVIYMAWCCGNYSYCYTLCAFMGSHVKCYVEQSWVKNRYVNRVNDLMLQEVLTGELL